MEDQVNRLANKAWDSFLKTPKEKRLLIAVGGIPGSGKTTLSLLITKLLNNRYKALHPDQLPIAAFVPMDGFHLTRAQLSAMPDPENAHARRGAEFTFDGEGFLRLVQKLAEPVTPESTPIFAPSFDHAVKDPKENDICVEPSHRIVVFEGNYLLLNKHPWSTASSYMTHRWFISVPPAVARERLARRHLAAGIASTLKEAERRADENDIPNGNEVIRLILPKDQVDEMIVSLEDKSWAA